MIEKPCETCGKSFSRPKTRSHAWFEKARFCSNQCRNRGVKRIRPVAERFWEKVKRSGPEECWPWTGAIGHKGYGRFTVRAGKTVTASRFAYQLEHGELPSRHGVVRHSCDNPPCCNPRHLILGDYVDNERDKIARGRNRKAVGEAAPTSKLTADQVRSIRRRWDAGEASQSEMARELGMHSATISAICRRVSWRHV